MAPNNKSLRLLSISINSRVSSVSTRLDKLLWYRQQLSTMPRTGLLEPSQSKNGYWRQARKLRTKVRNLTGGMFKLLLRVVSPAKGHGVVPNHRVSIRHYQFTENPKGFIHYMMDCASLRLMIVSIFPSNHP